VSSFSKIEGSRLVAIADPDDKRRGKAVAKYDVPGAYDDYQALAKDPAVDLVVVSAPTPLHAKAALAAIEAGKHVLCEMPLASNLAEADSIIEAAERQGVLLLPSLTFRFTPNYLKAKEMIQSGAVGKPTSVLYREFISARDLAGQWPAGGWMWQKEESGGPLYTLSVWSIDLFRWLFDCEITEVHASTTYSTIEKYGGTLGYDSSAVVKLENGVTGCLQYSGSTNPAASGAVLEIFGDSTSVVKATDNKSITLYGDDPATTEWDVFQPGARMWGHYQQDEYFIQCILAGKTPDLTPADGRRAMEIAVEIA